MFKIEIRDPQGVVVGVLDAEWPVDKSASLVRLIEDTVDMELEATDARFFEDDDLFDEEFFDDETPPRFEEGDVDGNLAEEDTY